MKNELERIVEHKNKAMIDDYRQLVKLMIKQDQSCQSPSCGLSMLGHLTYGALNDVLDLVKAEDAEYMEELSQEAGTK